MTGQTFELAQFATMLGDQDVPVNVRRRVEALVLDTVGVALGARNTPAIVALLAGLGDLQMKGGGGTALGHDGPWRWPAATQINGALAHTLDFDDTHASAGLHPSAPILPAALAAAEMTDAGGSRLITGLVAGYETMIRLSASATPAAQADRNFHPTAVCGVFGAAAAAGSILGLTAQQMDWAFGLAGSRAAGSSQFLLSGAWNKPFHVGAAAADGLAAAILAARGYVGASEALEGPRGFLRSYGDASQPAALVAGLGQRWETLSIGIKPYPCCRHSHGPLDAVLELRRDHALDPQRIRRITVGMARQGLEAVGRPEALKRAARSFVDGQFSLHFVIAAALTRGRLTLEDFDLLGHGDIDALCARIEVVEDTECEARYPAHLASVVEIETDHGVYRRRIDDPSGEPDAFPTRAQQLAKFEGLAGPVLGEAATHEAGRRILDLDAEPSVRELLRLLIPAPTPSRAA